MVPLVSLEDDMAVDVVEAGVFDGQHPAREVDIDAAFGRSRGSL